MVFGTPAHKFPSPQSHEIVTHPFSPSHLASSALAITKGTLSLLSPCPPIFRPTTVMADDLDEAEDERSIELTTIAAIYPELVLDPSDPFTATIDIPVEPIKPLAVLFPPLAEGDASAGLPTPPDSNSKTLTSTEPAGPNPQLQVPCGDAREVHELSYLPPVTLRVHLPLGYPDGVPPDLKLSTGVPWLPVDTLQNLEKDGIRLWEETGRSQMLFAYIDYLREAAEGGFSLALSQPLTVSRNLEIVLLDFDIKAKRAKFERATFECGVCLEPKRGAVCHRISQCGHVFCVECLQDFYTNCITEGDVGSVKCIAPKCGQDANMGPATPIASNRSKNRRKRDRTLEPSELLQIPLEQDIVQRYIKMKRKKALESDQTTVYCPRQWCQGPARSKKTEALDRGVEDGSDDDSPGEVANDGAKPPERPIPPAERLAICTDCTFAFCRVCKASWHGEFVICDPKRKGELTAEEKASEEYIKLHTSPCPTCNAKCQKTHGCNHMICFKCSTHFCYLCSSWLDAGNPYGHFNNPKKSCYMRLWELEAGDGDDVGRGFAGGFDESDDDGQDDNPLDELSDVDSEDEAEPPRAPPAPPGPQRRNPRAQNIVVRLPPARIQAAIERRAAAAPVPANGVGVGRAPPEPQAQAVQPAPANVRLFQLPPGLIRRRPIDGIQRFLDMARNDEEDAWDSDELDDESGSDEEFWQIPIR
ncbi:MAG: hypothetical protein Q9188_003253 [Gyalolechia gomerana]